MESLVPHTCSPILHMSLDIGLRNSIQVCETVQCLEYRSVPGKKLILEHNPRHWNSLEVTAVHINPMEPIPGPTNTFPKVPRIHPKSQNQLKSPGSHRSPLITLEVLWTHQRSWKHIPGPQILHQLPRAHCRSQLIGIKPRVLELTPEALRYVQSPFEENPSPWKTPWLPVKDIPDSYNISPVPWNTL